MKTAPPLYERIAAGEFPPALGVPRNLIAFAAEGINPTRLSVKDVEAANVRHARGDVRRAPAGQTGWAF
jgi:hypothetical protein